MESFEYFLSLTQEVPGMALDADRLRTSHRELSAMRPSNRPALVALPGSVGRTAPMVSGDLAA